HRTLAATPERVWAALTDPSALAAWFWPPALRTELERDPGGYEIRAPGQMAVRGTYDEIDPPHRLRFTWQWDGETEQTAVSIDLSGVDGGTAVTLIHEGFADEVSRDNHIQGWSDCLDRLPEYLAGESLRSDSPPAL